MNNFFINKLTSEIVKLSGSKVIDRKRYVKYVVFGTPGVQMMLHGKFHSKYVPMSDSTIATIFAAVNQSTAKGTLYFKGES